MTTAWLSVLVKRGSDVVKSHTVLKCSWNDSFGSLLAQFSDLSGETIETICISRNDMFISPNHTVPIDAPVSICDQFGCAYVCIYVAQLCSGIDSGQPRRNAFEMLMNRSREYVRPSPIEPPVGRELRQDQLLYNNLLGKFHVYFNTCVYVLYKCTCTACV